MNQSDKIVGYYGIFFAIFFGVLSQVIVKWQVNSAGSLPADTASRAWFLVHMLLRPWILISIIATLGGGLSWMVAMTKFDISFAYPYMSLIYVIMMMAGVVLFNEPLNSYKISGTLIIIAGIIIISRGN